MVVKSTRSHARIRIALMAAICLAFATPAAAAIPGVSKFDGADTAWLLLSSALVLMMTIPGLALFYGGMVRRKNVLSTLMQSFILVAIVSIQWVLFGYSLAFSPGSAFVGSLSWAGLSGVSATQPYAAYSATVPHQAYMIYQCMFAVITPALITGAIAERMSFKGFLVFSIMWVTLIYDPLAHWVWGVGGWIHEMGALDFAGGTVVHISSGVAALAAALMVGPRRGYRHEPMPPHNLTMTAHRRGLAVGRMVRVQRGKFARRRRSGGVRVCRDSSRRLGRDADVGGGGMVDRRQAHGAGRGERRGRGTGRDNARIGVTSAPARR